MTDLFFRIAQRALGLAPTIQPLIAPLFAPTFYANGEELLDVMATEEQGSQRSATAIAHVMPEGDGYLQRGLQPGMAADASKEVSVANQPGTSPFPSVPSIERHAAVTAYPEIERQAAQTPVPTPEQDVPAQSRYDLPAKNMQLASTMDGHTQHALPVIERPGDNQAERRSTSLALTRVKPRPTIPPSLPFTGQLASESTQRGLFHDEARSLPRDRPIKQYGGESLPESVQTSHVTPAVHVTIGRIEVRAHPVSPTYVQPQRQHTVPKTMSLDEYLKQSEKGGR